MAGALRKGWGTSFTLSDKPVEPVKSIGAGKICRAAAGCLMGKTIESSIGVEMIFMGPLRPRKFQGKKPVLINLAGADSKTFLRPGLHIRVTENIANVGHSDPRPVAVIVAP